METSSTRGENQLKEPLLATTSSSPLPDERSALTMRQENEANGEAVVGNLTPDDDGGENQQELQATGNIEENNAGNDGIVRDAPQETPWYNCPLQLVAMLSNYSTSYNVVNISMVIPILKQTIPGTRPEDAAASASSLLAGMIFGQLLGGYLGDSPVLGRLGALQLVMALQVIASLCSAMISSHMSRDSFYILLAIFRFLLGVGAGGVYPLAAVLSAEQGENKDGRAAFQAPEDEESEEQHSQKQTHSVVLTFSMQGLGFITAPLVTVPLLYMTNNLDVIWRIILGLGCIPGLILMIFQLWIHRKDSHEAIPLDDETVEDEVVATTSDANANTSKEGNVEDQERPMSPNEDDNDGLLLRDMQRMEEELRGENTSRWAAICREPNLIQKLMGTAATWFLFDVLFYGNTLFQPIVIEAAFGTTKKGSGDATNVLREMAINSLILTSIALPGYAVAGAVIGKRVCCIMQSPKYVMLQGFGAMSALYLAIGLNWNFLRHHPALLVLLYGMTFFFANYGPNTTTFILPSLVFSPDCRTTLNGVSAAAGKLGALTGATLFEPVSVKFGAAHVMTICSIIAMLSFLMTFKFVEVHPTGNDRSL